MGARGRGELRAPRAAPPAAPAPGTGQGQPLRTECYPGFAEEQNRRVTAPLPQPCCQPQLPSVSPPRHADSSPVARYGRYPSPAHPKTNFQAFPASSSSYISSRGGASPEQRPGLKRSPCRCAPGGRSWSVAPCPRERACPSALTRAFSTVPAKTSPLTPTPGCCQGFQSVFQTMEKVLKSPYSDCKVDFMVVKANSLSCTPILEMAGP